MILFILFAHNHAKQTKIQKPEKNSNRGETLLEYSENCWILFKEATITFGAVLLFDFSIYLSTGEYTKLHLNNQPAITSFKSSMRKEINRMKKEKLSKEIAITKIQQNLAHFEDP